MIYKDCIHECGDEDCGKCIKHGIIFDCSGCKDYMSWCEDYRTTANDTQKNDEVKQ